MPIGTPHGTLDYKQVSKVTFVGASSNTVIDTTTGSVGIGVVGDALSSNLHVVGDTRMEGNINMLHTSNTASIKLNSNVVTEFPRSKKLIKYPRVAMIADAQTNSGYQGHFVSRSTQFGSYNAWEAFDNDNPHDPSVGAQAGWASAGPSTETDTYNWSTGAVTSQAATHHTGAVQGEWIQIQLPDAIYLHDIKIHSRAETNYTDNMTGFPKNVYLYGKKSNDWVLVKEFTTSSRTLGDAYTEYIEYTKEAFTHFVLVVNSIHVSTNSISGHPGWTSIGQIEFFGIPEYDPEAHGVDMKVTSYPNVPNTDWLEVYYDGQDYTSMPAAVTDKSGNNRNGSFNGGVGFDSTYKAFTFNGVDQYIKFDSGLTGNAIFSVSMWFISTGPAVETLFQINGDYTGTSGELAWLYKSGNGLFFDFHNNSLQVDYSAFNSNDDWNHVVVTFDGNAATGRCIYANGVKLSGTLGGSSSGTALSLTNNAQAVIGAMHRTTQNDYIHEMVGKIANFRLFNRVITQDEVWQLYAYQKEYFGHGDLGMTLKAGRLGIGTSEPRAVLDVKGDTFSRVYKGGRTTFLTWDYVGQRSTSFSAAGSTHGAPSDNTILDYTFTIPSCYHHLEKANLKAHVQIDWRGECEEPWNFGFRIEIRYNGESQLVNSSESDHASTSGNKINGLPCISYYANANFDSTPEAASVTSTFALPNCDVSPGSTLKVGLVGRNGENTAKTVWTGRTSGFSDTSPAHELPTTSFFVVLDVDDGY